MAVWMVGLGQAHRPRVLQPAAVEAYNLLLHMQQNLVKQFQVRAGTLAEGDRTVWSVTATSAQFFGPAA